MKINLGQLPLRDAVAFAIDPDLSFTFSQEGEDLLLEELFQGKLASGGFYVDVGAHHPRRFSNTYAFYLRGWRGINIDAAPGSMEPFRQIRPRDINIEVGVAETEGDLDFFIFNEAALNTFDPARVDFLQRTTGFRVHETRKVPTRRLDRILDEHLPPGQAIDFLNVDAEGLDGAVARSNDWSRHRPRVVLMEDHAADLMAITENENLRLLRSVGYRPIVKLPRSVIFIDERALTP